MKNIIFLGSEYDYSVLESINPYDDFKLLRMPKNTIDFKKSSNLLIEGGSIIDSYKIIKGLGQNSAFYYAKGIPKYDFSNYKKAVNKKNLMISDIKEKTKKIDLLMDKLSEIPKEEKELREKKRKKIKEMKDSIALIREELKSSFNIRNIKQQLSVPMNMIHLHTVLKNGSDIILVDPGEKNHSYSLLILNNGSTHSSVEEWTKEAKIINYTELNDILNRLKCDYPVLKMPIDKKWETNYDTIENLVNFANEIENFISTDYDIPNVNSFNIGEVVPVAELKTNIMASLVASGIVNLNKNIEVNGEDVAVHQIMVKNTFSETKYKDGQPIEVKTSKWENILGMYNFIRKEFNLISE